MYNTIELRIMLLMFFVVCIVSLAQWALNECPRTGISKEKVFFAAGMLLALVPCLTLRYVTLASLGSAATAYERIIAATGRYVLLVSSLIFTVLAFLNAGMQVLHNKNVARQRQNDNE